MKGCPNDCGNLRVLKEEVRTIKAGRTYSLSQQNTIFYLTYIFERYWFYGLRAKI